MIIVSRSDTAILLEQQQRHLQAGHQGGNGLLLPDQPVQPQLQPGSSEEPRPTISTIQSVFLA